MIAAYPPLLAEKLAACGAPLRDRNVHRCRSPACPTCRTLRGRAEGRRAVKFFDGATNERMALVTIASGIVPDLGNTSHVNRKMVYDLRNVIARERRNWPARWGSIGFYGWPEADVIEADAVPIMPPGIQKYLQAAKPAWNSAGVAWSVHWHMIADCGRVDWQELRDVLADQFDLPGQIDVRPFWRDHSMHENVTAIARYCHAFKTGKAWSGVANWWPVGPTADYYAVMALSGWSGKRLMLKPKTIQVPRLPRLSHEPNEFDAMPVVI